MVKKISEKIKTFFIEFAIFFVLFLFVIYLGCIFAWDWITSVKYIKQNKMKQMKQAVLDTAKKLMTPNNRTTTLELKLQLRKDYPNFYWNQDKVSKLMDEFATKGNFTYTDNGTYRTYSDPTIKIAKVRTKRAKTVTPLVFVAKVTKKAVVKKAVKKATKAAVIKVKNPMHNVPSISRTKALSLMQNNKGHFFTAVFVKKDGTDRKMNCQYMADQGTQALGYVKVKDMVLRKIDPNDCIRNLNLQTLKEIKIAGKFYKVK